MGRFKKKVVNNIGKIYEKNCEKKLIIKKSTFDQWEINVLTPRRDLII